MLTTKTTSDIDTPVARVQPLSSQPIVVALGAGAKAAENAFICDIIDESAYNELFTGITPVNTQVDSMAGGDSVQLALNRATPVLARIARRGVERERTGIHGKVVSPVYNAFVLGNALQRVALHLSQIGIEIEGKARRCGDSRTIFIQSILKK